VDHEAQHPSTTTYLVVAGILTVLTAMEVLVYQIPALGPVMIPVLLVLMVAKFTLVAMFYMHLRFDPRMFTGVFVLLLFYAGVVVVSLFLLFLYFRTVHHA
jgi:cytochrome c oxidase subunit IV